MAEVARPVIVVPPSILLLLPELASLSPDQSVYKMYTEQIEVLILQVKDILMASTVDVVEKVKLIDGLCRLGVSYHFETEIENQLNQIFNSNFLDDNEYDLCIVALMFRVFRQHGYKMSCDVFEKFKNSDGKFKNSLTCDVEGLLSLYEATHLSMNGEDIMDEALTYTSEHLKSMATHCSPRFAQHIGYALKNPFHKGISRIESRQYISFYEEDKSCNQLLLKLAKTDFNRVQLLHQQELVEILRWHKDLNAEENFPYSRDRPVEGYLWSVGTFFEQHYSSARILISKFISLLTYVDDTYDAYGAIEELRLLTNSIQRWDSDHLDEAPNSMKILCMAFLDLFHEIDKEFKSDGKSYDLSHAIDAVKAQFRYYQLEAEWLNKDYMPRFEEYMANAGLSTCYHLIATVAFTGMREIAGVKEFKWLKSFPKIDEAAMIICRLMDDLERSEREKQWKHIPTGIECYMKTYGVSKEEAVEELQKIVSKAWKDINEELIKPTIISRPLLMVFLNLSRIMDVLYKHKDSYTYSECLKDCIKSLFLDAIPM